MELQPTFIRKPLRNQPAPFREVSKEQPWHRAAAYMFARGSNIGEVARALDKAHTTVANALRLPWFQQNVMEIMAESGAKDILEMFRAEQFNSLVTLIELRDDDEKPAKVRLDAARDILDRALGKPTQRVEAVLPKQYLDPAEEERMLREENARLQQTLSLS